MLRNAAIPAIAIGFLLQGCASVAEIEARQLAYNGEGPDECLWGGVTEKAEAKCAELRWGLEGYLISVNKRAIGEQYSDELAPTYAMGLQFYDEQDPIDCQAHVTAVQKVLAARSDLRTRLLYSCPPGGEDCHVSVLVTDVSGRQFVLDNGAVLTGALTVAGVGSINQFAVAVNHNYREVDSIGATSPIMLSLER